MVSETTKSRFNAAFFLSLAAGILIIFGNIIPLLFVDRQWNPMNWIYAMDGDEGDGTMMMRYSGHGMGLMNGLPFYLFLVSGFIVLIGATMLNKSPQTTLTGAILVIMFSIFGLFGMGISLLGGMLGIIGGISALNERNNRIKA